MDAIVTLDNFKLMVCFVQHKCVDCVLLFNLIKFNFIHWNTYHLNECVWVRAINDVCVCAALYERTWTVYINKFHMSHSNMPTTISFFVCVIFFPRFSSSSSSFSYYYYYYYYYVVHMLFVCLCNYIYFIFSYFIFLLLFFTRFVYLFIYVRRAHTFTSRTDARHHYSFVSYVRTLCVIMYVYLFQTLAI